MLFTLYRDGEISKDAKSEISSLFADKDKRIAELEKQVADMKCCGNCNNYFHSTVDAYYCCKNYLKHPRPNHYCDNWQSDNITREERK